MRFVHLIEQDFPLLGGKFPRAGRYVRYYRPSWFAFSSQRYVYTTRFRTRHQPYITWGYPNLKTVRELIYKRGYGKVNGQRIAFTDNSVIEENVGNIGLQSIEDLIHEIFTVGPNFKRVCIATT